MALQLAGSENIEDYRPLINDVLIRVRTELCVLESFVRETAIPFFRNHGFTWIFPFHETTETYLAGVVFMIGLNFILLGSTKILAVIGIYHDITFGLISRVVGKLLDYVNPAAYNRENKINILLEEQSKEIRRVMLQSMDSPAREDNIAEINKRYLQLVENEQRSIKVTQEEYDQSILGRVEPVVVTALTSFKLYGSASRSIRW
eukprot:CAMPEP_0183819666 /NCGR_PEP_ID=MMETSP0803_2-20130417/64251_1 /TAXON_ID=195967 /ORGANISM="Crustomastix stigmata, Strain CCMP3273" /LENGTH=203 /DNA_ID=CAMNT_0026064555 /DNA_START=360 /DNA_END=968 /DNA_ORIENTATION=-